VIEAVVFDLDGTLVDLPIDYENLFDEFKRIMRVDSVRPLAETVPKTDAKTRRRVFRAWDRAELGCCEKITVNEEGMKIYRENPELPKALVTLQGKKVVKAIVEKLKLSFDAVVTREDALRRDEQLTEAGEKLQTPLHNILFVGNTEGDAAAAEKVGCQFLRVKKQAPRHPSETP
jgi:HAD superfamily hydrolase (TIGR01549 family)